MSVSVRAVLVEGPPRAPAPYTYASTPRALYNNVKLKREPSCGAMAPYANVMHEKRVVRGSTFGAHPHAAGDGAESAAARAARTRRRALARRAAAARLRPGTPPPAPGRRHHPIQTDHYLEELFEKGVELEVGVQTDLFVERPASPVYVPAKTGADAATQIYPGDLFDFDVEVQPIVEALVGKTTEQALAETAQEEEIAALREGQRRLREMARAAAADRRRLRAADERLRHEKERRVQSACAAVSAGAEARARAAAAALAAGPVQALGARVLEGLRAHGRLHDPAGAAAERAAHWLQREVARDMQDLLTTRDLVTEVVRDVVEARAARAAVAPAADHDHDDDHDDDDVSSPPADYEAELEEAAE